MIVLRTINGTATVCPEPGARNSNRLPVNANGLVRLRSPGSVGSARQGVDTNDHGALAL